ncbi:acyl-CoA carboxylase subunit epsilon [Corynebacterium lubricantis]|uniref:acyl-CoA carboxylase subunit epsilon n=1 Tax=Corynebacterium lubricantis TaxID=541095 RepID=UPI00036348BB|nr:acyl-CoA carboxylase subunit epsilon [Corynebacterium lubricantis]
MSTSTSPIFKVLKGSPSDVELAALTAVISGLQSDAKRNTKDAESNLWGTPKARMAAQTLYNPGAFSTVTFY